MKRQSRQTLPVVAFIREVLRQRDTLGICIATAVLLFSIFPLVLPISPGVRVAAARRFQLAGWPFPLWALFQPLPSMYNFENHWEVAFTSIAGTTADETCRREFGGFVNHHVLDAVFLGRVALERCGFPAHVRFRTTYRGTTVESGYVLTAGPGLHGFILTPQPE
ncbi:MAG: hypothetical protein ABJA98_10845 [Acidobacteriota bacterium]